MHPQWVAGIKSEWWPASIRNGGRHQIGIPAGITSEYLAGMRRNLQLTSCPRLKSVQSYRSTLVNPNSPETCLLDLLRRTVCALAAMKLRNTATCAVCARPHQPLCRTMHFVQYIEVHILNKSVRFSHVREDSVRDLFRSTHHRHAGRRSE